MSHAAPAIFTALVGHLRAMQLSYHREHLMASGPNFIADHEMFGEFYAEVEGDFDAVSERSIGFGFDEVAEPNKYMSALHNVLDLSLMDSETQLCALIKLACDLPIISIGFEQLLGDIAQRSEIRQYKLKRRAS